MYIYNYIYTYNYIYMCVGTHKHTRVSGCVLYNIYATLSCIQLLHT